MGTTRSCDALTQKFSEKAEQAEVKQWKRGNFFNCTQCTTSNNERRLVEGGGEGQRGLREKPGGSRNHREKRRGSRRD